MKNNAKVLGVLAVFSFVFLVIFGIGILNKPELPHPNIAMPGADVQLNIELPKSLTVPEVAEAYIYELAVDLATIPSEIETCLNIDLTNAEGVSAMGFQSYDTADYTIIVDENSGYWTYQQKSNENMARDKTDFVSDDDAKEIAQAFVSENALWDGEFSNVVVTHITSGGWNSEEYIKEKKIYFYPRLNNEAVLGVFRIIITVDATGTITGVKKQVNPINAEIPVDVKTRNALATDIVQGNRSISATSSLENVSLTSCKLQYYADAVSINNKTYLYPVFVLLGTGQTSENLNESFDIIVDAMK